jgi:hypothetical protein
MRQIMPMFEIIQVTAQYSNAVLVAVLPYVSDFAQKLELPVPHPITISQVREFKCSPRSDLFGGRVVLTNGYEFAFVHGHVEMYRTPKCYYELQDPDLVPRFFGPVKLKEKDALKVVHQAIKKLGYVDATLYADRAPRITPPARIGKNYVPRYRIWWGDPTRGSPDNPPTSADFEVDATTGQIQMMYLLNPATFRQSPTVDVHPPVVSNSAETRYRGGRPMVAVSQAYSNAFLTAILPQCSAYIKAAGFAVPLPIGTNDVDMSRYICSLVDNDPMAVVDLKTHARFVYRHGQVIAFYAPDVMHVPGEDDNKSAQQFFGPINMTSNQAVALVRQTVVRLGYSEKVLHLDDDPFVNGPAKHGGGIIARYFLNWKESREGAFRVVAEVDATTKLLKSLYINDHANTNIWREPPKISILPGAE